MGMELIAFRNPDLPAHYHVENFMAITRLKPFLPPAGQQ
jgi:hypothetical protein